MAFDAHELEGPLVAGDRFPATLRFERAGEVTVELWVQPSAGQADPAADRTAIGQLMRAQFDKSEARLVVAPVVAQGDHALAGWSQGDRGGRLAPSPCRPMAYRGVWR